MVGDPMTPTRPRGDVSHSWKPSAPSGACESCYKNKEKCVFDHKDRSCSRCTLLQKACVPRQRKRMGRPPQAGKFSHGDCSILKFPSQKSTGHIKSSKHAEELSRANPTIQPLVRSSQRSKGVRVSELGSSENDNIRAVANTPSKILDLITLKPPGLSHPYLDVVLGTSEGFFEVHRHFVLGMNFLDEFHNSIRILLGHAPDVLSPAYLIVLQLIGRRHLEHTQPNEANLTLGSACLKHLIHHKSSAITNVRDAAVTLLLGQILLIYNTLISCPSARTITRGALLHTKEWYPDLMQQPEFDSVAIASIVIDVTECLIRRELPILRLPDTNRPIVDRLLGLCSSLLQHLHDLCLISHRVKSQTSRTSAENFYEDPYLEIEQKIMAWQPSIPTSFTIKYHASERVLILGQAKAYRIAALLVIHRLRFPFGAEDENGSWLAETILQDLYVLSKRPSDGTTGLGLDFPLLVALLELPDRGQDVFELFESLRFRKKQSQEILQFVRFVRNCYKDGYRGLWFDLVDQHLPNMLFP